LSRLVVTLQRKQFIVRRRSGVDGRALSISLTDKGKAMTERIIPIASHYEEVAIRGINAGDLRRLKRLLIKLFSNIKTLEEEVATREKTEKRNNSRRS
jgi:DNA-binding MarR family transcriptional regulator